MRTKDHRTKHSAIDETSYFIIKFIPNVETSQAREKCAALKPFLLPSFKKLYVVTTTNTNTDGNSHIIIIHNKELELWLN